MSNFKDFYLTEKEEEQIDSFIEALATDIEKGMSEDEIAEKYGDVSEEMLDVIEKIINDGDFSALYTEIDQEDPEEEISERLVKKIVVRKGKKMKKWKSDRKNYRIVLDPSSNRPKEVRMNPEEVRKRKRSQRLGALKRKATSALAKIKRKISLRKRSTLGVRR